MTVPLSLTGCRKSIRAEKKQCLLGTVKFSRERGGVLTWKLFRIHIQLAYPGSRFSKAPKAFRARKVILSSSVYENGEVYIPETFCMKRNSVHIKNMWIKQLRNCKVPDFAMALRARKVFGAFEKRASGYFHAKQIDFVRIQPCNEVNSLLTRQTKLCWPKWGGLFWKTKTPWNA